MRYIYENVDNELKRLNRGQSEKDVILTLTDSEFEGINLSLVDFSVTRKFIKMKRLGYNLTLLRGSK
tara:strand:+ start:144 stop:344 length:201 start_codon:yes stop_codon:yes gene_type:complete